MKRIGRDVSAAEYWKQEGSDYHDAIENPYHRHRLAVVRSLITSKPQSVLDFGCGDGVMFLDFPEAKLIGIEPDAGLIDQARERVPMAKLIHGSVDQMADVPSESVDLLLCLNVLAYMTDAEDERFYSEARRVLRRGGTMVVTHSNELFDLFSLNAYTVEFFRRYFGCEAGSLLANPSKPETVTYNIRENPLTYAEKLGRYGFREERQGFINFHPQPPLIGGEPVTKLDTINVHTGDRWKLMFQCSTFASLSVRI